MSDWQNLFTWHGLVNENIDQVSKEKNGQLVEGLGPHHKFHLVRLHRYYIRKLQITWDHKNGNGCQHIVSSWKKERRCNENYSSNNQDRTFEEAHPGQFLSSEENLILVERLADSLVDDIICFTLDFQLKDLNFHAFVHLKYFLSCRRYHLKV